MIHGGLGLIEEYAPGRHALFLPPAVLHALNIEDQMCLYGVYYPSKEGMKGFAFTPIPPCYWPQVGRYIIRVKHQTPALTEKAYPSGSGSAHIW
jgi:hypothetical protein